MICNNTQVTLTASAASSFLWSTHASSQAISVSQSGNYSVTATDINGCISSSILVSVSVDSFAVANTIYIENFGSPAAITLVNSYTGWQNGAPIVYSSSSSTQSDVRTTNASNSYLNASGGGNVFMGIATSGIRNLIISGINSSSYPNLVLSFGLRRESSGTDTLLLEVSADGTNYSPLYFQQLNASNIWTLVTTSGNIPAVPNLRIRFSKNSLSTQFRIDDLKLSYSYNTPVISAAGPTTFCSGNSVTLNSSSASSYIWSNSLTTQNIVVNTAGNYFVTQTAPNGCTAISNSINISISPSVTPSVGISANTGLTICSSTPVTFTASSVNGGTAPNFNFKVNNFSRQNGSSNFYTTSTLANNDVVICELSSNANCATTSVASSNSLTMTVNPAVTPAITLSITNGSQNTCAGTSVTFTANATNGGSTPNYNFKVNNISKQSGSSNTYTTSALLNNDVVIGELTSNANCATILVVNSNSITVAVNPNITPTINLAISNGSQNTCAGTSVTFTANATNGGSTPSYNFKVNNISKQNGALYSYTTATLANNDVVICELTSNAICASPLTITSSSIHMTVTQPPTWYLDYDNDGYYLNGSSLIQCTNPGAGYNTVVIAGGDCNDSNAFVNPGAAEICNNLIDDNCNGVIDEGCIMTVSLHLKLFIEGFYLQGGSMSIGDTINVELHDVALPNTLLFSKRDIIDQNGNGIFTFPNGVLNNSYYVVIRHRNTIETWTKVPVLFNSTSINFDFTGY